MKKSEIEKYYETEQNLQIEEYEEYIDDYLDNNAVIIANKRR